MGFKMSEKKTKTKKCQDDTDAPTQGHPHPHAGILQKTAIRRDGKSPDRTANGRLFSINGIRDVILSRDTLV